MRSSVCITWLSEALAQDLPVTPADFEAAHAVAAECDAEAREVIATLLSTISMAMRGDAAPATQRTEQESRATAAALRVAATPEAERSPALRRLVNALWDARDGGSMPRVRAVRRAASADDRAYLDHLSTTAEAARRAL